MILLQAFWFFLPAAQANMAPIWVKKIPYLRNFSQPLDFGRTYRGQRILGDNKTIRGFVIAIIVGWMVAALQSLAYHQWSWVRDISLLDYASLSPLLWGFLQGFGAIAGDAIKSFIKRQTNHAPGSTWVPFDQLDYIAGSLIAALPVIRLTAGQYLAVVVVGLLLHVLFTHIGYYLHFKDSPL